MRLSLFLSLFLALTACDNDTARADMQNTPKAPDTVTVEQENPFSEQDNDWLILPGERVGPVTASTTEAELTKRFGPASVQRERLPVGEGMTEPGTRLFAGTGHELMVFWKDTIQYSQPERVVIRGDGREWHTENGLHLGSPLDSVEVMNGGPFLLTGFGWDYSGTVTDWQKGRFNRDYLLVRLDHDANALQADLMEVMGDKEFSSTNPHMKAINPKVYEIVVYFP